jgi:hypothetical protein
MCSSLPPFLPSSLPPFLPLVLQSYCDKFATLLVSSWEHVLYVVCSMWILTCIALRSIRGSTCIFNAGARVYVCMYVCMKEKGMCLYVKSRLLTLDARVTNWSVILETLSPPASGRVSRSTSTLSISKDLGPGSMVVEEREAREKKSVRGDERTLARRVDIW